MLTILFLKYHYLNIQKKIFYNMTAASRDREKYFFVNLLIYFVNINKNYYFNNFSVNLILKSSIYFMQHMVKVNVKSI